MFQFFFWINHGLFGDIHLCQWEELNLLNFSDVFMQKKIFLYAKKKQSLSITFRVSVLFRIRWIVPNVAIYKKKLHTQIFWNSQRNHNSQWYQKLQRYRKSYIEYSGTIEYKEQQIVAVSNGFIKYECCKHQHFFFDKTRHFSSYFMFGKKKGKIFFKLCFFHNMALKSVFIKCIYPK